MLVSLGWVVAAFLGGYLLCGIVRSRERSLRQNFSRVEQFIGRSYREVIMIAGSLPRSSTPQEDGTRLCTWRSAGYSITLQFDNNNVCLGVIDEKY